MHASGPNASAIAAALTAQPLATLPQGATPRKAVDLFCALECM